MGNRPSGIVIIAVLWTLVSVISLVSSLPVIVNDLGVLPYLSDPAAPEWFKLGFPAEIVLNFFIVALSLLTMCTVYGLYSAKPWSHRAAYVMSLFVFVVNSGVTGLYVSAPSELGLGESVSSGFAVMLVSLTWMLIIWVYLMKPHVKQYLSSSAKLVSPTTFMEVPPLPTFDATTENKKHCRHCGAENGDDAVFCDKCGYRIREN